MQLSCGFRRESTSNHLFCSFSASGQETKLLPPQQQCQVKAPKFFLIFHFDLELLPWHLAMFGFS
jgi:hypothetical protein